MNMEAAKEFPRSRAQLMAAHAWRAVGNALEKENFVQLAKGAPALVMANGLMQALAYWQARGKAGGKALVDIVASWLLKKHGEASKFEEVMKALHGASSPQFARATREALELLRWVKQFASALGQKES